MKKRSLILMSGLLCVAVAGLIWHFAARSKVTSSAVRPMPLVTTTVSGPAVSSMAAVATNAAVAKTNRFAYRLSNTTKTLKELQPIPHAILLENALIDTDSKLDLAIPTTLRAAGDPGAYIVQARGVVNAGFRAALTAAGAQMVSYIPNNAYLVRLAPAGAGILASNALVQAVLPYEPYYKLQPSLLGRAVKAQPLPPGAALTLGLYSADAPATEAQIEQLGGTIIARDGSVFCPVLRVLAPADWTALARLPGVRIMEPAHRRETANDLSRVTTGVSIDGTTTNLLNYLNLTGLNVLVAVNDTGVDTNHPDFSLVGSAAAPGTVPPSRVTGFTPFDLVDTNGHGTFDAGIIAGNGSESSTINNATNLPEGSVVGADFRGKAPAANIFSINFGYSDYVLQTNAALQGALISNNSWDNGDPAYDLAAASYDFATRDALPFSPGSQPVLFVFAAGDDGGGDNDGQEGSADTIMSPGTAKNVITVGALEQNRNITNLVSTITPSVDTNGNPVLVTNQVAYWQPQTDSGSQVAFYSSRGNVGVGTEGTFGRFKPDVVAPGTFVVSTRSSEWDTNAYFNPTNVEITSYTYQTVPTNTLEYYNASVPPNAVGVVITITPNNLSNPFPTNMPIYVAQSFQPTTNFNDFVTTKDGVTIPPDGGAGYLQQVQNGGFYFAVGNSTNVAVNYDLTVAVLLTNNVGDRYQVLAAMDQSLAPYYRYESGTSMSAAEVSGILALMQDYFTNTLQLTPSPALLKAMLINGSRSAGNYGFALTNGINFQGWGLVNLQNSLPFTTNGPAIGTNAPMFFADQNPATALATGDSHTYIITINTNDFADYLNLQATLVWTDPPGDPAAAIKLVNNLDMVITNLDTGDVYIGNDISASGFNQPWNTNGPPNLDTINNVEQIILQPQLAGSYSVTVIGRAVNVNAVTAQTNNVVQDFALVIACGEGEVTNAITVTDSGISSNPVGDQDITYVITTNAPLYNQMVGANPPLLGTNTLALGTNTVWGSGGALTIGMTNQWHFYVVTNIGPALDYTNAAFITFDPYTLSIPRMGVYADTVANATRPEADIDLFATTDSNLLILDPITISNCLNGVANGRSSLSQGGTEFVYYTNSVPGEVYYVGVKSEDRMASEYAFMPIFTDTPFSQLNGNGDLVVNGLNLPVPIPDGDNAHPGVTNVFALAIPLIPDMVVEKVTVTNLNEHQNYGDLFGALSFGSTYVVLNNHDGLGNTYGSTNRVYDDSLDPAAGTIHSDGPGSLVDFRSKGALGPWILSQMDNSLTQTGRVTTYQLVIQPHRNFKEPASIIVYIPPGGWFIDYVDVPPGYTNLSFFATNLPPTISPFPLQMYERFGNEPTLTVYDQEADLTNSLPGTGNYPVGADPGNDISVGPPLNAGQYFIGIYNPSTATTAQVLLTATLGIGTTASDVYSYTSSGSVPLLDDAVSGSTQYIAATQTVASVNVGIVVKDPRISDLTFTLVSPTGQRILLMENRGAYDTNGAGAEFVYTNFLNATATGGASANTNYLVVSPNGGTVPITYNFYTVPDEMTVYAGTNPANFYLTSPNFLYDTGFTNNPASGGGGAQNTLPQTINVPYPPGITAITIIMNQFGNPYGGNGDAWTYTAGAPITNFQYLVFTDDTNLANVPIKYSIPPYNFSELASNYTLSDFEQAKSGDYLAPTNIYDAFGGWTMTTNRLVGTNLVAWSNNLVSVVTDPSDSIGDNVGSNFLALANGTIARAIPTIPGHQYNVIFWYRGPGITSWWRGEGNASDSSDPENNGNNGTLVGRFNFPAGVVNQAFEFEDEGSQFQFGGTNTYVQIPQNSSLDVGKGGGFSVEGWINPTNLAQPQPLVEWLAHVPTNSALTNLVILAGPYLNRATDHYYYLLGATNWTTSEYWAEQLGGHLATLNTANEQNWVFDNFASFGGTNRNLWIGLTNNSVFPTTLGWVSGETNVLYDNWAAAQPTNNDNTRNYTFMFGNTNLQAGLWTAANNNGFVAGSAVTNTVYGVVEVNSIQTNGVQFWVSATNTPGTTNAAFVKGNGCLYANLVDTNFVSHEIYSAPGLLQSNVYQHVALTYDTNSGLAILYLNGTNVASTNLGVFVPKTDGDVLLGRDMTLYTNNYFGGEMDEISIYRRALSDAEIAAIYALSAPGTNGIGNTNGMIGKFDPSVTPAAGLAEAQVVFGTVTNVIFGVNNQWKANSYTFVANSNSMPLQLTGLEPGILLDSFTVSEAPVTNLYYMPEQALNSLTGNSAQGTWSMQVWDNRVGAYVTNYSSLVSWQLTFVLESNAVISASLDPQTPLSSTVGSGQTVYYSVTVPAWAHYATNVLVSSDLPVDMFYFNPANMPTGSNPSDATLLTASTGGSGVPILATNGIPPAQLTLLPGQTYYLGVRNNGIHAASVVLEVAYDILGLTNGVPFTGVLTNEYDPVRYFQFQVGSNAYEATFQLLDLSGNADLVLRHGVPLPTLTNADFGSFNAGNVDENIFVLTNSQPIPLSAGTWYLGVFQRDSGPVSYTVLAKELDSTNTYGNNGYNLIPLTNGVPFNFTAGPGAALTNYFTFTVSNAVNGLRFELYDLSGNGDLTVQPNAPPLAPPFFQSSQNPGLSAELVLIQTNNVLTNLTAVWYLGVPNNEISNINYTIIAAIQTNGYFPAFPGAEGSGGGSAGGRFGDVYHVITTSDSGAGSLRNGVNSALTNRTVIFDVAGTINLLSPLVITNSYLTIAGQTAPGGGITVAGQMTSFQSAHDITIRDVRFRRGAVDDSLQLTNLSNVIVDHISAEWSDNLVSVLNSSNVTVQWSVMADSLYVANDPPTGSLLRYGAGALSFHHNLYADNYSGSPQLGDNISLDFVNNVIYNWGLFPGLSGGTNDLVASVNGFTNELNYTCNYLIAGPDTVNFATNYAITNIAFFGGTTNALAATWIFQTNNVLDHNDNGILDGANTQWGMFTNDYTSFDQPFPLLPVATDEAFIAYERVLDFAGVNMSLRDSVDAQIVNKVRNQSGTLISAQPLAGLVGWWKGENNAVDSIANNNGVVVNAGFTNGVVNRAFSFDPENYPYGTYCGVDIPDSPAYILTNSLSIEGWVRPRGDGYAIFWRGDNRPGLDPYVLGMQGNHNLVFAITDASGNSATVGAGVVNIPYNAWSHVAGTLDGSTGDMKLYVNGVLMSQINTAIRPMGALIPGDNPGVGIGNVNDGANNFPFAGDVDEISLYKRALSAAEINSIYNAGSAGKFAQTASPAAFLDTDFDGIPDFWEITFGTDPFTPNNNQVHNSAGYTDLEVYDNWLAAPHALTVTNTPVSVDLLQLCGKTGNLSFCVTNAINGSVYLTNVIGSVINTGPFSNSIAVFTPVSNTIVGTNFYGYASFDLYVTNSDTVASFGPVTVSVVVSAVPIAYATNGYLPPVFLYPTNTMVTNILETVPFTASCVATDLDVPPMPLTFALVSGPVGGGLTVAPNGLINWTPTEAQGPSTNSILVSVSNGAYSVTNSFTIIVEESNLPPVLFLPPSATIEQYAPYSARATATDPDLPINPLTFALVSGPAGLTVSSNGIINWTPSFLSNGTYNVSISVTDTNIYGVNTQSYNVTSNYNLTINPPPILTNGVPQTNSIGGSTGGIGGGFYWYRVNVPTNADWATNILLFATNGPVNVWLSTNLPPTIVNPSDALVLPQSTSGTNVMGTNSLPPLIPGSFYYIGVQNTNSFTVTYGIEVIFHLIVPHMVPYAFTQPATLVTGASAQLNGMASPNGLPGTAWFQWGTNGNYGFLTPPIAVGSGQNVVYVNNPIGGLVANLPYHFRLVVSNALGVAYGFDQILDEANVVAWGADYIGQTNVPPGLSNVVAIAGAYDHNLALNNNATVVAWGDNSFGQTNVPAGLNNVVAVAGGRFQSLALKSNGTVVAWGSHSFGVTNVPAGLNNVIGIAGGDYYSVALQNNGLLVAWGANAFGVTNVPPGLNNVVAVAGGGYHCLALINNGTVVAWGDNSSGQASVPPGLTNVVAIAGGEFHSLALRSDGTVVAWGLDDDGETNVPSGLSNVIGIAGGGYHSLALQNGGAVVGWGYDEDGETDLPVGVANVVAVSAGQFHSLALSSLLGFNNTNTSPPVFTNGVPQTNSIAANSLAWYQVNVPANADIATNSLLSASAPLNIWFSTNAPPTITNPGDVELIPNTTNGISILSTSSAPTNIVPGSTYYLGVQNTNNLSVSYAVQVNFHLLTPTNPPVFVSGIIQTNIGGKNGFLLTWFAPSNELFQVQWTPALVPPGWNTFTNIISYNTNVPVGPTNAQFNYFDDGSQSGGFGPTRFYRLILLGTPTPTNTAPQFVGTPTNQIISPLTTLIVTNSATDADVPTNTLTYTLATAPAGMVINTNTGVITWTPTLAQGGTTNTVTTVVTDNGVPPLSATNLFTVTVTRPVPVFISSVTFTNHGSTNGFLVTWYAPTNYQFQIQWANALVPPGWSSSITNIISYTGPVTVTNGLFTYFDDGSKTALPFGSSRFYRLVLFGSVAAAHTLTLPAQTNIIVKVGNAINVTNAATDSSSGAVLNYSLVSPPAGASINTTNGIIVWTNAAPAGIARRMTTIVTDSTLTATNTFTVFVMPFPAITNVTGTATNTILSWLAPTNDQFQVQWSTNLVPAIHWFTFTGTLTSTNSIYTFVDTNAPMPVKFYRLILLP